MVLKGLSWIARRRGSPTSVPGINDPSSSSRFVPYVTLDPEQQEDMVQYPAINDLAKHPWISMSQDHRDKSRTLIPMPSECVSTSQNWKSQGVARICLPQTG